MKKEGDGRIVKEDNYIIEVLENFITDLKTDTPVTKLIDAYACQLTAYMQGQILLFGWGNERRKG